MTPSIDVDGLRFQFPDGWSVEKWDDSDAYRQGLAKLDGCQAVDIVAACGELCWLIEVKNYRKWTRDIDKQKPGELAPIVAHKTRDTLAGLVAAARERSKEPGRKEFIEAVITQRRLRVTLWMEEDHLGSGPRDGHTEEERRRAAFGHFTTQLRNRLRWLTKDVTVESKRFKPSVEGVVVSDVP